jgi:beta-glucanase (GH16 family)
LGNDDITAGFPACGESDIEERVDAAQNPDWNQSTIHGPGYAQPGLPTSYYFPSGQTAAGWHTYGMIWQPGSIQYYIDSPTNIYATYTPASLETISGAVWPFDSGNGLYIIFDLAIGGDWPGPPNSSTPFPSQVLVDYVRIYAIGNGVTAQANRR